jgi:ribosomal protein S18 acetylase RimI-like enzyme
MIRKLSSEEPLPWPLLLDADPEKEVVDRYIETSEILVYEKEQRIVGVIVFQLQTAGWEIMNVAVAPNLQNQGIGACLLTAALGEIAATKNQAPLPVTIKTGNLPSAALTLYKKMGFVEKRVVKNYFVDHYKEPIYEDGILLTDQVILEKIL